MSPKLRGITTIIMAVALALSLLPSVTYAGGYYRHHHRHHRHYYKHHHHHGHSVRLWIDLRPYPGGWVALPAERGEYRVWTPSVQVVQPERSVTREQSPQESYCREFQRDVIIDGKPERAYGTACLQPDGSWKIVP